MNRRYVFSSLTRICPLPELEFNVQPLPKDEWATGDYVVCEIYAPPSGINHIELTDGREMSVMQGDLIVGALGKRRATLEATGTWTRVGEDMKMHVLTSAGLFGKLVSKSPFTAALIRIKYHGHVHLNGVKATMQGCITKVPLRDFTAPVILLVGTSMSAGKTTSARTIVRQLYNAGLKVLGAKLAGAGRYRDILGMADAGADYILDFVDVGLPSTIHPVEDYRVALRELLSMMAAKEADVAVVEIGSSPLEPYNGDAAIEAIRKNIVCTVLCTSDPYAVLGVMNAFKMDPNFVTGPATNTHAGIDLIEKLSGVPTLNLLDPDSIPALKQILGDTIRDFSLAEKEPS